MSGLPRSQTTPEEYLAWDLTHAGKHEFVNGEMWAMAGAHPAHNLLTVNLTATLAPKLRGHGCRALSADQRVQVEETGLYCYPDLTVVCGPLSLAPTQPPTLLNPTLIAEVLSPSTAAFDKDVKFAHYRRRASVMAILFVSWPERRVELYTRDGDGWRLTEARGNEVLPVATLGITLPLEEIYGGVEELLAAST